MNPVDFKKVGDQLLLAEPEKDFRVLEVWHASHSHADRHSVMCMDEKDVIRDTDMRQRSVLHDCSSDSREP